MAESKTSSDILYLECESGISGDMTVAALLDLGADEEVLMKALDSIPVCGYSVEITRVKKAGIDCCDFNVILDAEHENHDHDMEYLHGHENHNVNKHMHGHDFHAGHHHVHRGMAEIRDIINNTAMTENARGLALRIFNIVAVAESKAHNVPVEQVHFHEVGAVDSIVDVIATAVCIDNLGVSRVVIPKLVEGKGTIRCQHGILPIPVPAVANIVADNKLCIEFVDVHGEFVTPTGAAIAAAVKTDDRLPKRCRIKKLGIGAGKRNYERPSMLRAMIIEEQIEEQKEAEEAIYKLETNIDDCTGEALGYLMECLFENGARDVHYHPVFMKKNRPGWQVNVICEATNVERLENIIFRETTTIGIRKIRLERNTLDRQVVTIDTELGKADIKICTLPDGEKRYYPEYESVARLCKEHDIAYMDMYKRLSDMALKNIEIEL